MISMSKIKIEELRSLYMQDIHNYFEDEPNSRPIKAYKLIVEIKSRQADKLLETSSPQSRHLRCSKASSTSTTSSAARVKAPVRESTEYEHIIGE